MNNPEESSIGAPGDIEDFQQIISDYDRMISPNRSSTPMVVFDAVCQDAYG